MFNEKLTNRLSRTLMRNAINLWNMVTTEPLKKQALGLLVLFILVQPNYSAHYLPPLPPSQKIGKLATVRLVS
jgi:hypothetical protein